MRSAAIADDLGHAVMWIASAARILEAQGMAAEAGDLRRVQDRVIMLQGAGRREEAGTCD